LIVVDNQSTLQSQTALAQALEGTEIIESAINLGYAGGNNIGIARALEEHAEYVLLLNADAEVSETAVMEMLRCMEANPEIMVLGPVLEEQYGSVTQWHAGGRDIARHVRTRVSLQPSTFDQIAPILDVAYVPGTVFLARSSAFASIGLLDEDYFFSGEIADFCRRVRGAGHRVCIDTKGRARHTPDGGSEGLRSTLYRYYSIRNRFLYVRKHHGNAKAMYLSLWAVLATAMIVRALIKRELPNARAVWLALVDGLRNRYGNQNAKFC
jgi:GT2 family glycosyltransferase